MLVAQIDLEPGEYLVWENSPSVRMLGQLSGTSLASRRRPRHARLCGRGHDSTYVSIKPESGENNETVALLTAGKTSLRRKARLYFFNPSRWRFT